MDLKEYLKLHGTKVHWFAKKLGVNPRTLSAWLANNSSIPVPYWEKVAEITDDEVNIYSLWESWMKAHKHQ